MTIPTLALPRALVLGQMRAGGIQLLPVLAPHLNIVGFGTAPSFFAQPFPASLLAATLRTYSPPVQVVTMGGAFTPEDEQAARAVFAEHRAEVVAHPEQYGLEEKAWIGFVRTTGAQIAAVKEGLGVEAYEAVGKAIVRNLEEHKKRYEASS